MKKVEVEVCVCTACVMNGSVDIMESVESLSELRQQMHDGYVTEPRGRIEVCTNKCLGDCPHQDKSPVVSINGEIYAKADAESVMSRIIDLFKEEQE